MDHVLLEISTVSLIPRAAGLLSSGFFLENWKKFSTRSEQGVICCGAPCDGFPASPHTTHRSTGARVATWVAAQAEPGQHDGCKRQRDRASGQPPHQQALTRRVKQVVGHTHLGRDEGHVLDASLGEISTQQELHFPAQRVYGHSELAETTEVRAGGGEEACVERVLAACGDRRWGRAQGSREEGQQAQVRQVQEGGVVAWGEAKSCLVRF